MNNLTVGGSTPGEKNVPCDMELSHLLVSGSVEKSRLDVAAQARLDLGRAHSELHAFTSSRLPSSLKQYLLWGAVGLTGTVGFLSTAAGGMATGAFVGVTAIDGFNHWEGNAQANHLDHFSEWFFPVAGVVTGTVTALLARSAWNTGNWLLDLIGRENAEQLNALRHHVDAAEMGLANAVAELSASEWDAFLGGLEDGQLASIVQSFRLLPEDRLVRAMERIVDSGLIHQIGVSSGSTEEMTKLRTAYARYGDHLVNLMNSNRLQEKIDACGPRLPHLLACMALSDTGISTDLSDVLHAELQRPERQDQVHMAVHMLLGLSEMMAIRRDFVLQFGEGVGGIGVDLMEVASKTPWVSQWQL